MQFLQAVLMQIFPNASMYLSATALSVWILTSTGFIKYCWQQWQIYINHSKPNTMPSDYTIPNIDLVIITFLMAYGAVLVALIETGGIHDSQAVWGAFVLANSTAFTTNGIYTIIKHSILPSIFRNEKS